MEAPQQICITSGSTFTRRPLAAALTTQPAGFGSREPIPATRTGLHRCMKTLPKPWTVAMQASIFTGWLYDHLLPHAAHVKLAYPVMLRAIAAAKKKNDRI